MDPKKVLKGKMILIVDDELDVLDQLSEALDMCKIDRASTFDEAKEHLEKHPYYHLAILDIMGVQGYKLLEMAKEREIPAMMLTAHALSKENLKKSFENGAAYYVPKDEMTKIDVFAADIIDALEKNKNVFMRWYDRLGGFFDKRFGKDWKDENPEFWSDLSV